MLVWHLWAVLLSSVYIFFKKEKQITTEGEQNAGTNHKHMMFPHPLVLWNNFNKMKMSPLIIIWVLWQKTIDVRLHILNFTNSLNESTGVNWLHLTFAVIVPVTDTSPAISSAAGHCAAHFTLQWLPGVLDALSLKYKHFQMVRALHPVRFVFPSLAHTIWPFCLCSL